MFNEIANAHNSLDVHHAKALEEEMLSLLSSFRGFDSPSYNKASYEALLAKFEDFESNVISLWFMVPFYGHMARIALNCKNPTKAVMYALAGIELCSSLDDDAGVTANKNVLCDTALVMGSTVQAAKYFQTNNAYPTVPFRVMPSEDDAVVNALFKSKKRPPSFRFMMDEASIDHESKVRFAMRQFKISRATAIKQIKAIA
jgi:hypothetical protein